MDLDQLTIAGLFVELALVKMVQVFGLLQICPPSDLVMRFGLLQLVQPATWFESDFFSLCSGLEVLKSFVGKVVIKPDLRRSFNVIIHSGFDLLLVLVIWLLFFMR
jgi:hypothetical protein